MSIEDWEDGHDQAGGHGGHGIALREKAWTRQGKTRQGEARQGKARRARAKAYVLVVCRSIPCDIFLQADPKSTPQIDACAGGSAVCGTAECRSVAAQLERDLPQWR